MPTSPAAPAIQAPALPYLASDLAAAGMRHDAPMSLGATLGMLQERPWVAAMVALLLPIVILMALYCLRHLLFTVNRLYGRQRHPFIDIERASWPMVTVFVAAHNEERVIADCLDALLETTYPASQLRIIAINDRSTDGTRAIIDAYVARHPQRITALHRVGGKPGKSAALKEALPHAEGDIVLLFDADYIPGRGLLKQLVAPFFDPEVGAAMGRVVPMNTGCNLLTRLLDMERAGGYQVDQQARMNLKLVPQYGGTVGGIRRSALAAVGGWRDDVLAEDTDITFRLLQEGWKTVYTNRAECYEEVPQDWPTRVRQVRRWCKGHNQVLARCVAGVARSRFISARARLDGLMLLAVFAMPLLLMLGWMLVVALYFAHAGALLQLVIPAFALMAFGTAGNVAAFFEIAAAGILDDSRRRLRLLPFNLLCFFISLLTAARAACSLLLDWLLRRDLVWDKTMRYRQARGLS